MKRLMETIKIRDYWYMLASFMFTLIIPIIFLLCYHKTAYSIARNLVEESNEKIINSAMLYIDTNINNVKSTFDKLLFESDVKSFIHNKLDYKGSSDMYIVKQTKETLDKYSHYLDRNFISDVLILNSSSRTVLSRELDYANLSIFYPSVYKFGDYTQTQFFDLLNDIPIQGQFLSNQNVNIKDKSEQVITYIRPMHNESNKRVGYLIAHIRTQELINRFSALNYGDTGYFIIRDCSGNTLFSTQASIDENSTRDDFYISKTSNPNSAFSYELGLPKTYISQTINPMRKLIALYVLLSILLGIALSVVLSYLRIKPISELFSCFEPGQEKYEINTLSAGLHKIIEENSAIKIKLSEQFVLAKYELIHKVFNGDIGDDEITKIGQTLDCPTEGYYYVVLNIANKSLEQSNNLFLPATETALTNSGFSKHFMLPYKGKFVSCFVCIEINSPQKLSSMLKLLKQTLLSLGGFSASIFAGGIVNQIQGIAQSKIESDFLFINTENNGVYIHDLILDSSNFHYPIKTETILIKAISEGNAKKVSETLDNLFAANLNDKVINLTVYKRFIEGIINTFYRIESTLFITYKNKINCIEKIHSIKRSCIEIRQLAFSVTEQFITKNEISENSLKEEIMDYVKEHYCESCFTILDLADKFNMSYDCMYNYFKKTYCKTFSTVLEEMRIQKSIGLLRANENIDTIAKLCGYNSSHSFRRTFNKRFGVTPSAYREKSADEK